MSEFEDLMQRVTVLEREISGIKKRVDESSRSNGSLSQVAGSMNDYPEFAEVLRLGREIRRSERMDDDEGNN